MKLTIKAHNSSFSQLRNQFDLLIHWLDLQQISSDKVLPPSEEVANKLREKHPDSHILTDMPEHSETESVLIGKEDVKRAIASFPNGSSGGPDGLLPQHLKDMTNFTVGDPANTLLDDLVDFFNSTFNRFLMSNLDSNVKIRKFKD